MFGKGGERFPAFKEQTPGPGAYDPKLPQNDVGFKEFARQAGDRFSGDEDTGGERGGACMHAWRGQGNEHARAVPARRAIEQCMRAHAGCMHACMRGGLPGMHAPVNALRLGSSTPAATAHACRGATQRKVQGATRPHRPLQRPGTSPR